MAKVILDRLTKSFQEKSGAEVRAVDAINLTIEDREFMVLVGPSGCGKSTTLRMIAGLEEISEGEISIDGRVVNDILPKDRDIAMVFQNYALYPHMTVYENMAFGLKLRKMPKGEIDARVREAAAMLGLEAYLDRKPKALSGGQRQRVAVGRAIVRKPKVFLFDEPLSNLDAKMRGSTRTEISKLHERLDATMIYVTHDQVEAMTMGDRICVMNDGHIMQVAAPLELYNKPANLFVAGFIGSPPMNFFRGKLSSMGDRFGFVEDVTGEAVPIAITLPMRFDQQVRTQTDRPVVLGVRPEDIRVEAARVGSPAVRVEIAEPMGAETYLHLRSASTAFIARVLPTAAHESGSMLAVEFDDTRLHLFDAETEKAL